MKALLNLCLLGGPASAITAKRVGHRHLAFETEQRRYTIAVPPPRMIGPARAADVLPDVLRGAHGADAALVVMSCFDGVTADLLEQLRAAWSFGVRHVAGFLIAERGDDVDEATLELRQALVDVGFAGDDAAIATSWNPLLDALDRALPDVPRDAGADLFIALDEVWGRPGSFSAIGRVASGSVSEDDVVVVADPISGEAVRGRVSELCDAGDQAPLAVASAGQIVQCHVAAPLEIEGDCQAVIGTTSMKLGSALALALTPSAGHVLPGSKERLARCRFHIGHSKVRVARFDVDSGAAWLPQGEMVASRSGMPCVIVEDDTIIASGHVR